jgi:hypothetical protein
LKEVNEMDILIAGATGVMGAQSRTGSRGGRASGYSSLMEQGETGSAGACRSQDVELLDLFNSVAVRRAVAGHKVVINLAANIPPRARAFLLSAWRTNDRIRQEVSMNLVSAALAVGAARYTPKSFTSIYTWNDS